MLNKATIIGNLCADVDLRKTQSGDSVANLSIATNERWTDKQTGQKKEKAEFHRVVIWGKTADVAAKYLSKGSKVYIEGKLETRKWQNKDGQDQYTTEIVVKGFGGQMVMLDGKSDSQPSQHNEAKANGYQPQTNAGQAQSYSNDFDDDDIPFSYVNDKIICF